MSVGEFWGVWRPYMLTGRDCDSSDFENKFVCGEIMSYPDLKEHGSEAAVKAAGKLKQQGKTYESAFPSFPFPSLRFLGPSVGARCRSFKR